MIDNGSNNLVTLRYRLKDIAVEAVEQELQIGRSANPRWIVHRPRQRVRSRKAAVEALGLKAVALSAAPTVPMHDVDLPRLAMYSTWGSTQEVGWVRYAFDHFEVTYDLIFKERVKQGNLRAAYDVIVIPNQGRSAKGLVYDIEPRPGKPRWRIPNRTSSRTWACMANRTTSPAAWALKAWSSSANSWTPAER